MYMTLAASQIIMAIVIGTKHDVWSYRYFCISCPALFLANPPLALCLDPFFIFPLFFCFCVPILANPLLALYLEPFFIVFLYLCAFLPCTLLLYCFITLYIVKKVVMSRTHFHHNYIPIRRKQTLTDIHQGR